MIITHRMHEPLIRIALTKARLAHHSTRMSYWVLVHCLAAALLVPAQSYRSKVSQSMLMGHVPYEAGRTMGAIYRPRAPTCELNGPSASLTAEKRD